MIVYMATNKENGKRYIGITSRDFKIRKDAHIRDAKRGSKYLFHEAIKNYGEKCFKWEIICCAKNSEDLFHLEIQIIADRKPEYNMNEGGVGFSVGHKKRNGSRGRLGQSNSPAMRKKISDSLKKSKKHFRKKVICIDTGEIFKSLSEAGERKKTSWTNISRACHTGLRAAGLRFKFVRNTSKEFREKCRQRGLRGKDAWMNRRHIGPETSSKRVFCLDDFRIFESASAAARHYGVAKSAVIEHCNGYKRKGAKEVLRKTVSGKRFTYCETKLQMMVA